MERVTVRPIVYLPELLGGFKLAWTSADLYGNPVLLVYDDAPRLAGAGWSMRYEIVHFSKGQWARCPVKDITFPSELSHLQYVGAMPDGRYVVALDGPWDRSPSGISIWVLSSDGTLDTGFEGGEYISCLEVDKSGRIWCGYSEIGVFGDRPPATEGLAWFSGMGEPEYLHNSAVFELFRPASPAVEGYWVSHCQAINLVGGNDVWVFFDSAGPHNLMHLVDGKIAELHTDFPARSTTAFAIHGDLMLMPDLGLQPGGLVLMTLSDLESRQLVAVDDTGLPFPYQPFWCTGRGSQLFLANEEQLVALDIKNFK